MANTRQSTKRAGQALKRQTANTIVRSTTRTALRGAIEAFKSKDLAKAKVAYQSAVKALSKAARKISRLTLFVKKALPNVLGK